MTTATLTRPEGATDLNAILTAILETASNPNTDSALRQRGIAFATIETESGKRVDVLDSAGDVICYCRALDADAVPADHDHTDAIGFGTLTAARRYATAVVRQLRQRAERRADPDPVDAALDAAAFGTDAEYGAAMTALAAPIQVQAADFVAQTVAHLETLTAADALESDQDAPEAAPESDAVLESCPLGCGALVDLSETHVCHGELVAPSELSDDDRAIIARADAAIAAADALLTPAAPKPERRLKVVQPAAETESATEPEPLAAAPHACTCKDCGQTWTAKPVKVARAPRQASDSAAPRRQVRAEWPAGTTAAHMNAGRWHAIKADGELWCAPKRTNMTHVAADAETSTDLSLVSCPHCARYYRQLQG